MIRLVLWTVLASALYGFSIASIHSFRLARWNVVKFPLLILSTGVLCGPAYYVFAQLITRKLRLPDVAAMSLRTFRDTSILLASLSPVSYFLARTVAQPVGQDLKEYPFFLQLNLVFISVCGVVALVRQAVRLLRAHGLTVRESVLIVVTWLAISLFAGGQCAWYLRPFFGPSTIRDPRFIEGSHPDIRGATSFYEAVYNLFDRSPLPKEYQRYRQKRPARRADAPG